MKPSIEVILSAYNAVEPLRIVLDGYRRQTDPSFALAIADDGSGSEVGRLVGGFAERGLRIRHVWQEDRGFRRARILNRAVAGTDADYLILSDGDCVPSVHFVEDHREWAEEGCFVCGRRVELGPELTDRVRTGAVAPARLETGWWLVRESLRGRLRRGEAGLRPPRTLTRWLTSRPMGAWGCNIGLWTRDFVRVNGFDNDFENWGGEDTDLDWRLRAAGFRSKAMRGRGAVFHLFHESRASWDNTGRVAEKKRHGAWHARDGLREACDQWQPGP